MRKLFAAPVIVAAVVGLTGSAALAHECYNASRPAKGNEGASHSKAWGTVSLADVYADAVAHSEELGLPPAEEGNIDAMLADATARGVPPSFLIHVPSTAASGVYGSAKSSDGRDIDHFFAHYEGDLVDAYRCGAEDGPCATEMNEVLVGPGCGRDPPDFGGPVRVRR